MSEIPLWLSPDLKLKRSRNLSHSTTLSLPILYRNYYGDSWREGRQSIRVSLPDDILYYFANPQTGEKLRIIRRYHGLSNLPDTHISQHSQIKDLQVVSDLVPNANCRLYLYVVTDDLGQFREARFFYDKIRRSIDAFEPAGDFTISAEHLRDWAQTGKAGVNEELGKIFHPGPHQHTFITPVLTRIKQEIEALIAIIKSQSSQ